MPRQQDNAEPVMRLDKWLWCARFFKTRSLAAEAIKAGKVLVNRARVKPAKCIGTGAAILIKVGAFEYDVSVLALAKSRKSSREAGLLYCENNESLEKRKILSTQIKLDAMNSPRTHGRPTKRDRRTILRFKSRSRPS